MNKLLIALPVILLLALSGGIIFYKGNPYIQGQPVTIGQYDDCYDSKIYLIQNCQKNINDTDFLNAQDQFFSKTYNDHNMTPQCQKYKQERKESSYWYTLNWNNIYSNCYQDPQILAIANTSSCFMENYYTPIVIECAGLSQSEFFQK